MKLYKLAMLEKLGVLIDGDAPAAAEMLPGIAVETIPIGDLMALLPGVYYMDPPDGGDVSVLEQLRRMSVDARRYRESLDFLSAEDVRLQDENQRLRDALEIIEHTIATLRGEK